MSVWRQQPDIPKACLTGDEGDKTVVAFITYFVAAFQLVNPAFGLESRSSRC